MVRTKGKIKNKKSQSTLLDNKYNQLVRKMSIRSFEVSITECFHRYESEFIEEVFSYMKNIYYNIDKKECEQYLDPMYFMELLNYIQEYFILAGTGRKHVYEENDFIRTQFVTKLKENNVKFELLIYTSKVGFLYENISLYPDEVDFMYADVAKLITDAIFLYSQYITTYTCKFKNSEILSFVFDENHINIKYSSYPMLLKENIDLVNSSLDKGSVNPEKETKYISKITTQIHIAYSNFITRDIDSDYYAEYQGHLHIDCKYQLPFYNENVFILNKKELLKIPNDRLYATHSSGIRFEFINKEHNIDFIDMKESEKHINFNVHIINRGGMSVSLTNDELHEHYTSKKISITSNIIKIPYIIYKDNLYETTTLLEKQGTVQCLGFYPAGKENEFSLDFFIRMRNILLTCLYLAYYNPLLFKKEVTLHNRIIDKRTGYTRNSGFRIAHLKKLPTDYKASEEAVKNAKKEGFDSIPEGYTFVKASHLKSENEPDKKVIKLDI